MNTFTRLIGSLVIFTTLVACGGGGGGGDTPATTPAPSTGSNPTNSIASVTIDGRVADFTTTQQFNVKNSETISVALNAGASVGVSATFNGVSTPVGLVNPNITTALWSARLGTKPGSVVKLVFSQNSVPTNTLTFIVESAYQGTWRASYSGGESGSCAALNVSNLGVILGLCTRSVAGSPQFQVVGSINSSGQALFDTGNGTGSTSTGAIFNGTFTSTSASGTWANTSANLTGSWTATKQ